MLKRFMVETFDPHVGESSSDQLAELAARMNEALQKLDPGLQWEQSFVVGDKTYHLFLAESLELVQALAELAGFTVDEVSEVKALLDPTSEGELLDRPIKVPEGQSNIIFDVL